MAAVEQHIEYRRELFAGDVVTIRSSVLDVTEKSIKLIHEMTNDGRAEIAATTTVVGIHLDMTTRRARALPADVRGRALLITRNRPPDAVQASPGTTE